MEVRSKFDELKKSLPNPLPTPGMLHCYNYISLTSFHCYCSPVSGSGCEATIISVTLSHSGSSTTLLCTLIQTHNFHTREMWRHLLVLSHYDLKKRQGNLNKLSASRGFSNMQWRQLVKEPTVSVCVFNIFHENFNFYPTVGMSVVYWSTPRSTITRSVADSDLSREQQKVNYQRSAWRPHQGWIFMQIYHPITNSVIPTPFLWS